MTSIVLLPWLLRTLLFLLLFLLPLLCRGGLVCVPTNYSNIPVGAVNGQHLSSRDVPFTNNPNPACKICCPKYPRNHSCPYVDTPQECHEACVRHPNCSAYNFFSGSCNTGPNRSRTKHSCQLLDDSPVHITSDGHYISQMLKSLPPAPFWPPTPNHAPNYGCLYPYHNLSFCNSLLAPTDRARLLSEQLTPRELANSMNDEMGSIDRLGIPAYRYGHEGLHQFLQPCVVPEDGKNTGRCFTAFPARFAHKYNVMLTALNTYD